MLQLQLFGGFKLSTDDGQNIAIRLLKDRALLTYLALNAGKTFPRSALAGFLWSEQAEDKARHSLSQSLSSICDALAMHAPILERGRKEIVLQKDAVQVDLSEFEKLAIEKNFDNCYQAVELYQHDILSEVDFDEPEYEDWITEKRVAAQQLLIESGLLVLAVSNTLDPTSGINIAKKIIRVDPYCEVAHQYLIRQYLKTGNFKSAHH